MSRSFFPPLLAPLIVLSACAGPAQLTPIKTISDNPSGYLHANFTEAKLSESVRGTLGVGNAPSSIKRTIVLNVTQVMQEGDKKTEWGSIYNYYPLSNGLTRYHVQHTRNDILSSHSFFLSYGPLETLYQIANAASPTSNAMEHFKSFSSLDKGIANPSEQSTYSAEFLYGPVHLAHASSTIKTVCKTGKYETASRIHKDLPGRALQVDCERFGSNGQVFLKSSQWYLADLGIYVHKDSATTANKRTYTINQVTIR